MAPQCPEAAWASLQQQPEVIVQEQLALEGLAVPVLLAWAALCQVQALGAPRTT